MNINQFNSIGMRTWFEQRLGVPSEDEKHIRWIYYSPSLDKFLRLYSASTEHDMWVDDYTDLAYAYWDMYKIYAKYKFKSIVNNETGTYRKLFKHALRTTADIDIVAFDGDYADFTKAYPLVRDGQRVPTL